MVDKRKVGIPFGGGQLRHHLEGRILVRRLPVLCVFSCKSIFSNGKKSESDSRPSSMDKKLELDRVYSLYIRLRDAGDGGYTRCISCGKVFPFEQMQNGHFWGRKHIATRWDEHNCNSECSTCLTPDALIMMEDLTWKPLGLVKEGDKIVSFEEERKGKCREFCSGVVTHIHREIQEVFEVCLENGDKIKTTADHKWLARWRMGTSHHWIATKDMWINGENIFGKKKTGPQRNIGKNGTTIVCKPFLVVQEDCSRDAGWLAGMIDADGHICQQNIHNKNGTLRYGLRIGISQSEKYIKLCNKIRELITWFTFGKECTDQTKFSSTHDVLNSNYQMHSYLVTGTNAEKVHFLQRIRPCKIDKFDINKLGALKSRYDAKVVSITPLGKMEIVVMETDTHTFIANGYAMHNCNCQNENHLEGYRKNLILKIGQDAFDDLEKRHLIESKEPEDWEYDALIKGYKSLCRMLKKQKGIFISI